MKLDRKGNWGGHGTNYKGNLMPGSRRMPKGYYRDNMRAPK